MYSVTPCTDQVIWDTYVIDHGGHPLQLWGWGEVKAAHNWRVERVFVGNNAPVGAAQLLIRPLPAPLKSLVYIPRGPVCDEAGEPTGEILETLAAYAKRQYGAILLTIEPHWRQWPQLTGWRRSNNTILIPRTLILDLTRSDDELQAAMAKKTRQYIRKSAKEGIELSRVTTHDQLADCLAIYRETAERAGFPLHDDQYYYAIFDKLGDHSPVFIASEAGKPVVFLWLAVSGDIAFELYGGMNDRGQQLRANYALKWHAISTMKQWGIREYDMNGLLNDGVSTFKQGFANHEDLLIGTYDKPLSPLYWVWAVGLPYAKKLLRVIKRR